MLEYLDGKVEDTSFMRFSVACCRRVWPLITDPRSRAVVEVTEAWLDQKVTTEAAGRVCEEWTGAYEDGGVEDLVGTNEAIESVWGLGYGHAAIVASACCEAVGYAASEPLRAAGAPQPNITAAWLAAAQGEKEAQCELLRNLFGHAIAEK
jgi:hypothetical protein